MTPIIIYKTHTGFTESYVRILSESLDCPSVPLKNLTKTDLDPYDLLIYGGAVRASKISGFKKILHIFKQHPDKKAIVFAVGANGLSDENTQVLKTENLEANSVDYPMFYMQGGFDPNKLNFALKAMLNGVAKSLIKKEASDPDALSREDREFLNFFQDAHNDVHAENTEGLVAYIKGL